MSEKILPWDRVLEGLAIEPELKTDWDVKINSLVTSFGNRAPSVKRAQKPAPSTWGEALYLALNCLASRKSWYCSDPWHRWAINASSNQLKRMRMKQHRVVLREARLKQRAVRAETKRILSECRKKDAKKSATWGRILNALGKPPPSPWEKVIGLMVFKIYKARRRPVNERKRTETTWSAAIRRLISAEGKIRYRWTHRLDTIAYNHRRSVEGDAG